LLYYFNYNNNDSDGTEELNPRAWHRTQRIGNYCLLFNWVGVGFSRTTPDYDTGTGSSLSVGENMIIAS